MNRAILALAAALLSAGCAAPQAATGGPQRIIDMHRHTPWPGDSDAEGRVLIDVEMAKANVALAALFITGREDVAAFGGLGGERFLLSPMFPCPALTATRKWCYTEVGGMLPDLAWLESELAAGRLMGIGELAFSYAGMRPDDPAMAPYWSLAARHDVPAFVHSGRGPRPGLGPRRHHGCCPAYDGELGNPALLRPVLIRHPKLRIVLQHAGIDFMDEAIALMRDYPSVYADMSVLNSVLPRELHDASLRRMVDAGLADRIMLGSDDLDYAPIIERIEGAEFLTPTQRRGIYYDNAARFLRLDRNGRSALRSAWRHPCRARRNSAPSRRRRCRTGR